ncbi:hypothetical protein Vadar_011140 [Vaccinium darrowii]|uniref:Uncharacterized protein n=1 Tax=Vaccinium darrowii TaxID=229202 RepID=A0ACB7YD76_9ERIC|nr:hypothetical protein Vadar_011140 [Vaccinium darrowii]
MDLGWGLVLDSPEWRIYAAPNEVVNIEGADPDAFVVPPGDLLLIGCVSDVSFIAEVFDMVELRGDVLFVSSRVEVLGTIRGRGGREGEDRFHPVSQ